MLQEGIVSTAIKKILPVFLVLILSLAFIGCAEAGPAEEELTQEEIQEIVAQAASTTAAVDSSKFDVQLSMVVEAIGGAGAGKVTISTDSTGIMDNANEEMQMSMGMSMDIPDEGKQEVTMELYSVGGWMYAKIGMPGADAGWTKAAVDTELLKSMDQVAQQVALLETATNISLLGRESVRGVDCYVVEIEPSAEAVANSIGQQGSSVTGAMDISEFIDLFKDLSVKEWIAVESYLLMKSTIGMSMDASAADVGAAEEDFERMTMDINAEFEAYGYNEQVSIEVPEEALGASEVPGL